VTYVIPSTRLSDGKRSVTSGVTGTSSAVVQTKMMSAVDVVT